ncbi:MAG: hypothetical protein ACRCYR_11505 [Phycicoccus sp.]
MIPTTGEAALATTLTDLATVYSQQEHRLRRALVDVDVDLLGIDVPRGPGGGSSSASVENGAPPDVRIRIGEHDGDLDVTFSGAEAPSTPGDLTGAGAVGGPPASGIPVGVGLPGWGQLSGLAVPAAVAARSALDGHRTAGLEPGADRAVAATQDQVWSTGTSATGAQRDGATADLAAGARHGLGRGVGLDAPVSLVADAGNRVGGTPHTGGLLGNAYRFGAEALAAPSPGSPAAGTALAGATMAPFGRPLVPWSGASSLTAVGPRPSTDRRTDTVVDDPRHDPLDAGAAPDVRPDLGPGTGALVDLGPGGGGLGAADLSPLGGAGGGGGSGVALGGGGTPDTAAARPTVATAGTLAHGATPAASSAGNGASTMTTASPLGGMPMVPMMPMAPMAGGMGVQDGRGRPAWFVETHDVWGESTVVTAPVIE